MINRISEIAQLMRQRIGNEAAWAAEGNRHSCVCVCDELGKVAGAARIEPTSWYAYEVRNVVVREELQGKGWGRRVLTEAEHRAHCCGAMVMTATVREDNFASRCLFYGAGYRTAARFISNISGKPVVMLAKTLARIG